MPSKKSAAFNFETSLEKLNQIVDTMEQGGLSLEESLKNFEEGIRITRECQAALKDAEQKVEIMIQKNGTFSLEKYQTED
jgi:exodeoxyribonuclease VII small subunit